MMQVRPGAPTRRHLRRLLSSIISTRLKTFTLIVATNQEYVAYYVAFPQIRRAHTFIIPERYIIFESEN